MSYGLLDDAGFTFIGGGGQMKIYMGDELIAVGLKVKNGLYEMQFDYQSVTNFPNLKTSAEPGARVHAMVR